MKKKTTRSSTRRSIQGVNEERHQQGLDHLHVGDAKAARFVQFVAHGQTSKAWVKATVLRKLAALVRKSGMSIEDFHELLKLADSHRRLKLGESFRMLPRKVGLANPQYRTIERTESVCGWSARIVGTRIPVWTLVEARNQGVTEVQLLLDYPNLRALNLADAWAYEADHPDEIAAEIRLNEAA